MIRETEGVQKSVNEWVVPLALGVGPGAMYREPDGRFRLTRDPNGPGVDLFTDWG